MSIKTTVKVTLGDVKRRFGAVSYANLQETTNALFNGVCSLTVKADGRIIDSEASFVSAKRIAPQVLELQATCIGTAPAEQTRKPSGQREKSEDRAIEAERLREMREACRALLDSEAAEAARQIPASKRHMQQPDDDWDEDDDSSSTASSTNEDSVPVLYARTGKSSAHHWRAAAVPAVPTVSQKQLSRQMRIRMQQHTNNRSPAASVSQTRTEADTVRHPSSAVSSDKPVVNSDKAAAAVSSVLAAASSSVELVEGRQNSQCSDSSSSSSGDESVDDWNEEYCGAGMKSPRSGGSDVMRFRISASRTSRGSSVEGHTGQYQDYGDGEEYGEMCEYCAVFHHTSCENYADCHEYVQWLIMQNQILANRVKELETGYRRSRASSLPPRDKPEELTSDEYDDTLEYTGYQTHYTANPQDEYQFACHM